MASQISRSNKCVAIIFKAIYSYFNNYHASNKYKYIYKFINRGLRNCNIFKISQETFR